MLKPNTTPPNTFIVICRWHPPSNACEPWQLIAVVVTTCFDAQDAANSACLYLIWDRQGKAEAWLIIEDKLNLIVPDRGIFDAEDFDETITFTGMIVIASELNRKGCQ